LEALNGSQTLFDLYRPVKKSHSKQLNNIPTILNMSRFIATLSFSSKAIYFTLALILEVSDGIGMGFSFA
jgi:hypothetical protein